MQRQRRPDRLRSSRLRGLFRRDGFRPRSFPLGGGLLSGFHGSGLFVRVIAVISAVVVVVVKTVGAGPKRLDTKVLPQFVRYIIVDGAGMGHLLSDPELREQLKDKMRLHFQFPRKHVDTNLLHRKTNFVARRSETPN
jgi:hypothetical protein